MIKDHDPIIEDDHLRKRLLVISQIDKPTCPRWLLALVAAYQSLDIDDPYDKRLSDLIDQAQHDLGIDPEETFDQVSEYAE